MTRTRRLLCFLGFHKPVIKRRVYWGRCYHAELFCCCGRRFEAFAIDSTRFNLSFLKEEPTPTDFWWGYDMKQLPAFVDPPKEL